MKYPLLQSQSGIIVKGLIYLISVPKTSCASHCNIQDGEKKRNFYFYFSAIFWEISSSYIMEILYSRISFFLISFLFIKFSDGQSSFTVGITTIGNLPDCFDETGAYIYCYQFNLTEGANINTMSLYVKRSYATYFGLGIYDDLSGGPNNLRDHANTTSISAPGWATLTMSNQALLSIGTYYMCLVSCGSIETMYASTAPSLNFWGIPTTASAFVSHAANAQVVTGGENLSFYANFTSVPSTTTPTASSTNTNTGNPSSTTNTASTSTSTKTTTVISGSTTSVQTTAASQTSKINSTTSLKISVLFIAILAAALVLN